MFHSQLNSALFVDAWLTCTVVKIVIMIASNIYRVAVNTVTIVNIVVVIWVAIIFLLQSIICSLLNEFRDDDLLLLFLQMLLVVGLLLLLLTELIGSQDVINIFSIPHLKYKIKIIRNFLKESIESLLLCYLTV